MADEANSWIRRTNFSHTVCHRLDSSALGSIPFTINDARLRLRPFAVETQALACGPGRRNTVVSKQRSLSPLPDTALSDTFREARTERKRFSTPLPQRKEPGKGAKGRSIHKDSHQRSLQNSGTSLVRSSYSAKALDKAKGRKDGWTKYFDHGGGRVMAVDSADHWEVDMSKLFLGLRFAHGAHSRLYHGIYKEEPVAVKIIRVPDDDESNTLASRLENQFTREVTLLSRLHHRHVIKFVAASKKPPVYCIITEYLSEGSLRAYFHKLEDKSIPLQKLIAIALDVARGMEYVHSQGVIHRDLKPENILINQDFRLEIADFGIACEENSCDNLADDPGTYRWMAPEMIKRKSHGRKVDSYSFGLILWEMVAGTIPYEEMTPIQAAFAVVNKNLRPVVPKNCPPALQALIEQCWSVHPEKRPEFWQIVKVLEALDSSLARDGTLSLAPQGSTCPDHKKGLHHWIQKLGQMNHHAGSSIPALKPKFSRIWSDAMHIGQLQKGSHEEALSKGLF